MSIKKRRIQQMKIFVMHPLAAGIQMARQRGWAHDKILQIAGKRLFPGQSGTSFRTPKRCAQEEAAESPTGFGVRARQRRFHSGTQRFI
jgi:hypothetical protein